MVLVFYIIFYFNEFYKVYINLLEKCWKIRLLHLIYKISQKRKLLNIICYNLDKYHFALLRIKSPILSCVCSGYGGR